MRDQIVRDRPSGGLAERVSNQVVAEGEGPRRSRRVAAIFAFFFRHRTLERQETKLEVGGSSPPSVHQEQEGGTN